jgi:hypothetical protein
MNTQHTEAKHTPGPWAVSAVPMSKTLYPTMVVTASDGRALETVAHVSGEAVYANARLIAAAPCLLAAARALLSLDDAMMTGKGVDVEVEESARDALRTAILKAEGAQ